MVVLALAVFFLSRRMGNLGDVAHLLRTVQWRWMLLAVGAQAIAMCALALMQHVLLRTAGARHSRARTVLGVTLASNAVAQSLPGGVVFAEGYAFRQYRRIGADSAGAAWCELSSGALSVASLAGLALAGVALTGGDIARATLAPAAVVFVGATAAAALFARPDTLGRVLRWSLQRVRRVLPARVAGRLASADRPVREMGHIRPSRHGWAAAASFAALNWLADIVCLGFAVRAVHGHAPWNAMLLAFAAAQLLAMLPITIGGLGFVEGGLVVILSTFHVPGAVAGAAALAYRGVSFWLLLVLGWLCAGGIALANRRNGGLAGNGQPAGAAAG